MYKSLLAAQPTTQGYGALAASLLKRKKAEELLKVIAEAVARPGGLEAVQEPIKGIIDDPDFADQVLDAGLKLLSADPPGLERGRGRGPGLHRHPGQEARQVPADPATRPEAEPEPADLSRRSSASSSASRSTPTPTATFEEMLKKYPDERNGRQVAELARYYRLADKPDDAVRAAREALKLDPNDLDVRLQAALVLSQVGKADEAVEHAPRRRRRRTRPTPPSSVILGSVLAQAGRNDEALALFKGLLDKYPNNDEVVRTARSNLSIIYVNLGDYAKGEAELETLLERNPDDAGRQQRPRLPLRRAGQEPRKGRGDDPQGRPGRARQQRLPRQPRLGPVQARQGQGGASTRSKRPSSSSRSPRPAATRRSSSTSATSTSSSRRPPRPGPPGRRPRRPPPRPTRPTSGSPEIRKKLESLEKLGQVPKPSAGDTP